MLSTRLVVRSSCLSKLGGLDDRDSESLKFLFLQDGRSENPKGSTSDPKRAPMYELKPKYILYEL